MVSLFCNTCTPSTYVLTTSKRKTYAARTHVVNVRINAPCFFSPRVSGRVESFEQDRPLALCSVELAGPRSLRTSRLSHLQSRRQEQMSGYALDSKSCWISAPGRRNSPTVSMRDRRGPGGRGLGGVTTG